MQLGMNPVRRVVVKLGTGILTSGEGRLDAARIGALCAEMAGLRQRGLQVAVVSSGAIGLGMGELGLAKRPGELAVLQACAAIGQTILVDTWRRGFAPRGVKVAQMLLTREDVRGRKRHVAVMNTFEKLLSLGVVPVINENDSVSADEIKFGDNDLLSALVAIQIKADLLVILSTIPGLMDRPKDGRLVSLVDKITPEIEAMAGGTDSAASVGGMRSKIDAAAQATRSGCAVFIGSGREPDILTKLADGRPRGTFFLPSRVSLQSRKRWIAFFEKPGGTIRVDEGARAAVTGSGRSLLAKGITACEGEFPAGAVVNVAGPDGGVFARGIAQFGSACMARIAGMTTEQIRSLHPERKRFEAVHRASLVLLGK